MLKEFIDGFLLLCLYFIVLAILVFAVRFLLKPQREYIRKLMHTVCFMSIFVLTGMFDTWYLAAGASVLFALIVYPVLMICEKHPSYSEAFNQRSKGEVKTSLLLVFLMMAVMIVIFWGILGQDWKYIIIVAVLTWGFGDAAAALIGKRFGKHRIETTLVDGKKTWEGSLAMYFVSFSAIFISLLFYSGFPWYVSISIALIVASVSAFSELISRNGIDTVNVPFSTAVFLFGLIHIYNNWSI